MSNDSLWPRGFSAPRQLYPYNEDTPYVRSLGRRDTGQNDDDGDDGDGSNSTRQAEETQCHKRGGAITRDTMRPQEGDLGTGEGLNGDKNIRDDDDEDEDNEDNDDDDDDDDDDGDGDDGDIVELFMEGERDDFQRYYDQAEKVKSFCAPASLDDLKKDEADGGAAMILLDDRNAGTRQKRPYAGPMNAARLYQELSKKVHPKSGPGELWLSTNDRAYQKLAFPQRRQILGA